MKWFSYHSVVEGAMGLEIVLDLISPNCFLKNFVCSSTKFEGKTFLFSCAACFYRFYFYFSPSCSRLTKNLVIILNVVTIILSGSISFFWKYNYILCQEWFILWWGSHPTHECKINSFEFYHIIHIHMQIQKKKCIYLSLCNKIGKSTKHNMSIFVTHYVYKFYVC